MANDLTVFKRTLMKNGWQVSKTGGGHDRAVHTDLEFGKFLLLPTSTSDHARSLKNIVRDLKSLGFGPDGKLLVDETEVQQEQIAAREQARIAQEEREERSLLGRLTQSLESDEASSETPEALLSAATVEPDILDHPLLQFVVEDPPPKRGRQPKIQSSQTPVSNDRYKLPVGATSGYTFTMPELPKPGSKPSLEIPQDDFNADDILAGAIISPPVSALAQVWIDVFNKMPLDQWLKLPGTYPPVRVRAARTAATSLDEYKGIVRTEGSITSEELTMWLRKEVK